MKYIVIAIIAIFMFVVAGTLAVKSANEDYRTVMEGCKKTELFVITYHNPRVRIYDCTGVEGLEVKP